MKYVLSTPLFTDYAVKDRFIVLPKDSSIQYTVNGVLHFPDSTMIVKNFAYLNPSHQKVMIETRLLVKDPADHLWKVMDYLWNAGQTDAIRHITGARVPITFWMTRATSFLPITRCPIRTIVSVAIIMKECSVP